MIKSKTTIACCICEIPMPIKNRWDSYDPKPIKEYPARCCAACFKSTVVPARQTAAEELKAKRKKIGL